MQYLDDDIDDIFKNAADNYPVKNK